VGTLAIARPALAALVGRKPGGGVLQSIADGCTTTELARRVGISLAAASQHASVLRGAGLIATRRQGSAGAARAHAARRGTAAGQ